MSARPNERGVALLAAVLVVALATILIAGLLDRGVIGQARALQHTRSMQAFAFQHGLELWAARILRDDSERSPSDSRGDAWAQAMPPITVPEGMIHGSMRDLDGCLNLNALWAPDVGETLTRRRFDRLLRVLELDEDIAAAATDWIDPDDLSASGGAEDALYATLDPPRRVGNGPFAHVSELRAVAGIDAGIYERLAPHVCARPDTADSINVNTATPEVLRSLDDAIVPAIAQRLYGDGRASFGSPEEFEEWFVTEGIVLGDGALQSVDVRSFHFVAEADILLGEVPVRLYSLIERRDNRIRVLARSQGRF